MMTPERSLASLRAKPSRDEEFDVHGDQTVCCRKAKSPIKTFSDLLEEISVGTRVRR
jgi:hypothetical protein